MFSGDNNENNEDRKKLNDQTKILTWMVVVFVFCQCFTIVADSYDLICVLLVSTKSCPPNIHIENFIQLGHLMLAVNSSVNFIFYMIHIEKFRAEFIKVRIESSDMMINWCLIAYSEFRSEISECLTQYFTTSINNYKSLQSSEEIFTQSY